MFLSILGGLGRIWGGFEGRVEALGRPWEGPRLVQNWSKIVPTTNLKQNSILDRFGEGFGRVWEGG